MTTSAWITIECGYGHDLNLSPELNGTVTYYGSFFRPFIGVTLIKWTWRDLQIASEYVQSRQDYYKAERGFYHVLYQRACIKPNYPMPAIRYETRFIPYKDETWTAGLTTLCLAVFKPRGFGYICERYWFNT